jgi:hypothetical protein
LRCRYKCSNGGIYIKRNFDLYRGIVVYIILVVLMIYFITFFLPSHTTTIESQEEKELNAEHVQGDVNLVVNLKSKKYHLFTCKYATVKDESDIIKTYDEEFLMKHGYEPCQKCIFWR